VSPSKLSLRAGLICAGFGLCAALWLLLPSPDPHYGNILGPTWRRLARNPISRDLVREISAYTAEHGGRYPDNLAQLIPHRLDPVPDPDQLRANFLWRIRLWRAVRWLAALAVALWVLTFLVHPDRRRRPAAFAALATALAVLAAPGPWWRPVFPPAPEPSYDYLDRYVMVPGLRKPLPEFVPIAWLKEPYSFRGDYWTLFPYLSRCPFDLDRLEADLKAPVRELLSRAEEKDLNALLVLAVRKEPAAAALFDREDWRNDEDVQALREMHRPGPRPPRRTPDEDTIRKLFKKTHGGYDFGAELGRFGPEKDEILLRFAGSEDDHDRECAAFGLRYSGHPGAVPALLALLDNDRSLSESAAYSLGHHRDERAVEPLIEALGGSNGYMRRAAARALACIGDPRAIPAIRKLTPESEDEAREMKRHVQRLEAYRAYMKKRAAVPP